MTLTFAIFQKFLITIVVYETVNTKYEDAKDDNNTVKIVSLFHSKSFRHPIQPTLWPVSNGATRNL